VPLHAAISAAASKLGVELAHLSEAADRTEERVDAARQAVAEYLNSTLDDRQASQEPLIAAFGSMARQEMAPGSDFDYLVILLRLERDPGTIQTYRMAAVEALKKLGLDPPGSSGLFGCAISGTDLVNTIGLDTDSNLHLSRRILLLEESIGLTAVETHSNLLESIIARYLHGGRTGEPEVPRFLLNDVIRYWRTVAVDYEAKRWNDLHGKKWGLRYVKLLSTRKTVVAGTLVSLFWPVLTNTPTTTEMLRTQFEMPATARLAQLSTVLGPDALTHLRSALELADKFTGWLADADIRKSLAEVVDPGAEPGGTPMHEALAAARDLQTSLEALFFSDERLPNQDDLTIGQLSRRYLSF